MWFPTLGWIMSSTTILYCCIRSRHSDLAGALRKLAVHRAMMVANTQVSNHQDPFRDDKCQDKSEPGPPSDGASQKALLEEVMRKQSCRDVGKVFQEWVSLV